MTNRNYILLFDGIINFILGILLVLYSEDLAGFLGIPNVESSFYPNILGGVFIGIALALYLEARRKTTKVTNGLGLIGAIGINLCGGFVLLLWLIFGHLHIPVKGRILLWCLDILLMVISSTELISHLQSKEN